MSKSYMNELTTCKSLVAALRRIKVQTGSLMCLGCRHEHNCSIRGCAIIRDAADTLERLDDFSTSQCAKLLAENGRLRAAMESINNAAVEYMEGGLHEDERAAGIALARKIDEISGAFVSS